MCRDDYFTEEQKKLIYIKHWLYFKHATEPFQYYKAFKYVMDDNDKKALMSFLNSLNFVYEADFDILSKFYKTLDKNSPYYDKFYDQVFDLYDKAVSIRIMCKLAGKV